MRPSLSLIDESASPSIVNLGNPAAVSASTRTRWASTPTTAAVNDVASMTLPSTGKGESPAAGTRLESDVSEGGPNAGAAQSAGRA